MENKALKLLRLYYIPAIVWLAICTWLLTLPGEKNPPENIFTRLQADKVVHIILFSVLLILCCWSVSARKSMQNRLKKTFILIAILALAWGVGMEYVQRYLVVNRSFDVGDIAADGVGCAIGLIFSMKRYIKK